MTLREVPGSVVMVTTAQEYNQLMSIYRQAGWRRDGESQPRYLAVETGVIFNGPLYVTWSDCYEVTMRRPLHGRVFSVNYVIQCAGGEVQQVCKNSTPATTGRKGLAYMLKKLTNFLRVSLKQPQKSFYQLGWIELVDSELKPTTKGIQMVAHAILVENISDLGEYAKKEVKRLKDLETNE